MSVARRLQARWQAWRDARLTDPGFVSWASRFTLTRPIARRRAVQVFDLMAGFVYSQVLLAAVRLRLFDHLADHGPQSRASLETYLGMGGRGAGRLLDAAVSLRLLELRHSGTTVGHEAGSTETRFYGLGPLGAPFAHNPGLQQMVEHHATLYADLADPVNLLRTDGQSAAMQAYWTYITGTDDAAPSALGAQGVHDYSALMAASQPMVAEEVLAAHDFQHHRRILDVGGGDGTFLRQLAPHAPQAQLMLFDLPGVVSHARPLMDAAGLSERCTLHGGNFWTDELPHGADLITLVRVAFDHDDARVLRLLRAARRALPTNGELLLAEPMGGVPGLARMGDAYFGMYLLAMGRGRPRTAQEHKALLLEAGFSAVRQLSNPMPLNASVLLARR
jgi:demethylspheroidene O-methyltransferase